MAQFGLLINNIRLILSSPFGNKIGLKWYEMSMCLKSEAIIFQNFIYMVVNEVINYKMMPLGVSRM
jgi:hypothetical protein